MNIFESLSTNDAFKVAVKPVLVEASEITCLHCAHLAGCEDAESLAGSCEGFGPLTLPQSGEILAVPMEPLSFRCQGCDSHHLGWCRAVAGKHFYNIEFLAACPLEPNNDSN